MATPHTASSPPEPSAPGNRADAAQQAAPTSEQSAPAASPLLEKQRREMWLYVAVAIVAVELLVTVGALCYGFIAAAGVQGRYAFPWLVWGAVSGIAPACILLAVHLADVGLFRSGAREANDTEWQRHLPERMQRLYRIIKGAPAVVVLLSVVALGAALITIEGAFSALREFAAALAPHVPYLAGGLALVLCVGILAAVWLHHRTRRLHAEYAFRREVLEKTGVIIVDKGSMPLPPGGVGELPRAIAQANTQRGLAALPEGAPRPGEQHDTGPHRDEVIDAEATEIPGPSPRQ